MGTKIIWILFLVCSFLWLGLLSKRGKYLLHMMQLEGYKNEQYKRWLESSDRKYPKKLNFIIITVMTVVYLVISKITMNLYLFFIYVILWIINMYLSFEKKEEEVKKPLVFTNRAKRLYASSFVVSILFVVIGITIYSKNIKNTNFYLPIVLYIETLVYHFQSRNMILANLLVKPIEKKINNHYYTKAQEKIEKMKGLRVIGITGSFGKTSTKFITASILGQKFKVLNTPESYNTPMGLSKVINNNLKSEHEVFIAEMGARNIGDIEELAELTEPKIGVITSIGPAHLETFKNIDNIMKTKYELIEELPADGVAIFNYDNEHIKKLADKTFKEKLLYGMENVEELDIYATDIEVSEKGSTFTLKDNEGNETRCTTKLLGKHNIYNLLAGACVGKAMGLTYEEIKRGIEKVEPIPHRLNIINPGTGLIIIDDAFNSNPIGARAALEVLSQFKEGRKIIVTPGMVELGKREKEANREFGNDIAKICDYAILIGQKRTKPIYEGIVEVGYNKDNIYVVNNLDDATMVIQKIAKPKDVVLFENDLPDNYAE